jgi:hypothetical protein
MLQSIPQRVDHARGADGALWRAIEAWEVSADVGNFRNNRPEWGFSSVTLGHPTSASTPLA